MDQRIYTIIHLAGVMSLFAALGAVAASDGKSCKKLGAALHGIYKGAF